MTDPFTFIANLSAIIGITIQSCHFLIHFISNIWNASAEIEHFSRWLNALLSTLSILQKLSADPAVRHQLLHDVHFAERLKDCMDDLKTVEQEVIAAGHKLKANLPRRSWAKIKHGFLSDRSLSRFSWRLQMYQSTFTLAMAAAQMRLSAQNSTKLDDAMDAIKQIHIEASGPRSNLMSRDPVVCSQRTESDSLAIRAESLLQCETWLGSLLFWFGPIVERRGSCGGHIGDCENYRRGRGLAFQIRPRFMPSQYWCALNFSLLGFASSSWSISIQSSLGFPTIIPEDSSVIYHIKRNNIQNVKSIFASRKASPGDATPSGLSLLHVAVEAENAELVVLLLQQGADPNAKDCDGRTPIHSALGLAKNFEISRSLVTSGADLGNRDVEGKTPCHTFFNDVVGQVLLQYNDIDDLQSCDDNGMTIAHYVAWSIKSRACHIRASSSADAPHSIQSRDSLGRRAVHLAAQRGNIEILCHLLDSDSEPCINSTDNCGRTALHYATESKRVDAIKFLVSNGANIHAVDANGQTPLHRAAAKNNVLAIDCLIQLASKSDIGKVDHQFRNAETLARQCKAIEAAEHLKDISDMEVFSMTNDILRADDTPDRNASDQVAYMGSKKDGFELVASVGSWTAVLMALVFLLLSHSDGGYVD